MGKDTGQSPIGEAFDAGDEIVVLGVPISLPEDHPDHHNCDAMGCGSLSHVLYRFPKQVETEPQVEVAGGGSALLSRLDEIARLAWEGKYDRVGVLSSGERLYVALASGRMRELNPGDSIAYAVNRVGPEWMAHMLTVWRGSSQPRD